MKRNIKFINIIFFAITFGLLFASCSMAGAQKESSVSFKLDSETVQKIRNAAGKTAKPNARAADDDNLFVEVAVHGGYEDSNIVPLQDEAIVSIDKIPVGSEIYVEAIAFKKTGEDRQDLYKGQSKTFKVLNSDNFVMFIMHKVTSSESSGGGNSAGGSGLSVLFVSANASGDGLSESSPLASIDLAVNKIKSLVDAGTYADNEDWKIILLSDIPGDQTIGEQLNGKASSLTITSKDSSDIKVLGSSSSTIGLKILSTVPVIMQNLSVKYAPMGISLGDGEDAPDGTTTATVTGTSLTMKSGTTITENTGFGVVVFESSTFKMEDGIITGNRSNGGSGACLGVFVMGVFDMSGGIIEGDGETEIGSAMAVYMDPNSFCHFYMSGTAFIRENAQVSLNGSTICINGPLNPPSGVTTVAKIWLNSNEISNNMTLLETENGVDIGHVYNYFKVSSSINNGLQISPTGTLITGNSGG